MSISRRSFLKLPVALAAAASTSAVGAVAGGRFLSTEMGGAPTQGERLRRMQANPFWREGAFFNEPGGTGRPAEAEARWKKVRHLFANKSPELKPSIVIPHEKTDLRTLKDGEMVWLGHSGFVLRTAGLTMAVDPALNAACPVPGFFMPFKGADVYQSDDLPVIDILLITHDHYDHLDYPVIRDIRSRVKHVVCPLGVGAHFEAWGYDPRRITETVWWEDVRPAPGVRFTCVPGQHFSGRTLKMNTTLWAGYVLEIKGFTLYLSGDSGWGSHFAAVKNAFGSPDLAIMEDGQYNENWSNIHMMPTAWRRAVTDLSPRVVMPCHNSKYALSRHAWNDPLICARASANAVGTPLLTPLIGARISLADPMAAAKIWWS